jgi:hypothetical protein
MTETYDQNTHEGNARIAWNRTKGPEDPAFDGCAPAFKHELTYRAYNVAKTFSADYPFEQAVADLLKGGQADVLEEEGVSEIPDGQDEAVEKESVVEIPVVEARSAKRRK